MVRRILMCLCGMLALAAALWAQAETIEAYLEGVIGSPGPNNNATGAAPMTGWAVATTGIAKVVIQVDGIDIGQTHYGGVRPDVTAAKPGYVDSPAPGFGYHLNTTDFPNGIHRISAKVYTYGGSIVVLNQKYDVNFNNNPTILRPFGQLEYPQRNQQLYGTCDLNAGARIYTPVTGWALDLGVEIGDEGIGYVELLVDGSLLSYGIFNGFDGTGNAILLGGDYNTRAGCFFSYVTGGLTNCYGFPRQDIEVNYPYAINAPAAGFRFVLDIGFLISAYGYSQGAHVLTIRSGDILTNSENISEIPVLFLCEENLPDEGAFGEIETPHTDRPYEDTIVFQGWALDEDGIHLPLGTTPETYGTGHVDIWVDGQFVGRADYGVDARPGVAALFSGYPNALAPVWRFAWDSNTLADGLRQLQVYVVDDDGIPTLIGERSFFVDNVRHNP